MFDPASYSGAYELGDRSATGVLTVTKATSTVALTSSINPSRLRQQVVFRAVVSAQIAGTPSGRVRFFRGTGNTAVEFGAAAIEIIDGTSVATFTASGRVYGAHAIEARYDGDANFEPGDNGSSPLQQTVARPVARAQRK